MGSGIKVKIRPAENRASLPSSFGLGIGVDSGTGVEYGMRKIHKYKCLGPPSGKKMVSDGLDSYSHYVSACWYAAKAAVRSCIRRLCHACTRGADFLKSGFTLCSFSRTKWSCSKFQNLMLLS